MRRCPRIPTSCRPTSGRAMPEAADATSRRRAAAAARPCAACNAWYGESHVLHGVDFDVGSGEVVTLLGRNGAGKTTTLKSIMGIVPRREGSIVFEGEETIAPRVQPHRPARHRVVPGGARHLREPQRRGEPAAAADGARRRPVHRRDLRAVSQPEGAPREPGHQAVRRRAADARDRPHPAHRRAPAAARRADRGAGAGDRPADRRARSRS